ncbi:hypothetical protein AnigIFM60653_005881 [Aspergillus niger]|nr:hypothetical protein AnigIFM60653_005881 [Aspergillus niger]
MKAPTAVPKAVLEVLAALTAAPVAPVVLTAVPAVPAALEDLVVLMKALVATAALTAAPVVLVVLTAVLVALGPAEVPAVSKALTSRKSRIELTVIE